MFGPFTVSQARMTKFEIGFHKGHVLISNIS